MEEDQLSVRSMQEWCVFNLETIVEPFLDHTVAQPASARARARPPGRMDCASGSRAIGRLPAGIDAQIAQQFDKVDALISGGKRGAANKLLAKIDQRYGGSGRAAQLGISPKIAARPAAAWPKRGCRQRIACIHAQAL